MNTPKPGKYKNLVDFINRNKLQDEFKNAISGDRTVEQYTAEYSYIPDLTINVLHDIGISDRIRFDKGSKTKFTLKP